MNAFRIGLGALAAAVVASSSMFGAVSSEAAAIPSTRLEQQQQDTNVLEFGVYIRHDGNRVHLMTTDPGGLPAIYAGRIVTDGRIDDVVLNRPEAGDVALFGPRVAEFRFTTADFRDGLSFDVHRASRITFRLYRNGHEISSQHIFLGVDEHHPASNPFTILLP